MDFNFAVLVKLKPEEFEFPLQGAAETVQLSNTAAEYVLPTAREDQQLEVIIEQQSGVERVAIRYSTWTEGLGWCSQKTIRIDGDQLDDLHRALTVARHRIKQRHADEEQFQEPSRVIQFPTLG